MKSKFLLSGFCLLFSLLTAAQNNANKAFAIVSSDPGKPGWMNIQEIDLSTGKVVRTIFDRNTTGFVLLDGITKKKMDNTPPVKQVHGQNISVSAPTSTTNTASVNINTNKTDIIKTYSAITAQAVKNKVNSPAIWHERRINRYESPTASMVAAVAYDRRHNKLFFTPMRFGELRWIDLDEKNNSLQVYCLPSQALFPVESTDEGNYITRMVIAADGYGYGLSNDGKRFFRFTTGKKIEVTDLGEIKDDANTGESFHARSNWGGDMIADAAGNLLVISANRVVYRINIQTRNAKVIGTIEGLPKNYTTNGAAIDAAGNLIVSSANSLEGYFKVDQATLQAQKQETTAPVLGCSDLATGFFAGNSLAETEKIIERTADIEFRQVNVYPNPVTRGYFKVNFAGYEAGQYNIQLTELNGRVIYQKRVNVGMAGQTENISTMPGLAKGVYLVKIINSSKKTISSGKLLLQ